MKRDIPKKRRRFIPIRTKLTVLFVFVFLAPTVLFPTLLVPELERSFLEQANARAVSALRGMESDHQARGRAIREIVEHLSKDRELAFLYRVQRADPMRLGALISHVKTLRGVSGLDVLRLADESGAFVASGDDPAATGAAAGGDPALAHALRGETVFAIRGMPGQDQGQTAMLHYVPIRVVDPMDGVAASAVLMGGWIIDQAYVDRMHELSQALIVFYEGRMPSLASDPAILRSRAELPESFFANLQAGNTAPEEALFGGSRYLAGGISLSGSLPGEPLGYFVAGIALAEVYDVIDTMKRFVVYLSIGGFALCLAMGFFWAGALTKPLKKLTRMTRVIGGGVAAPKIEIRSSDELGLLGEAFNRMTGDLKDYHERLGRSERIAAWRDIARRIAHEIKNPLSPIQLAVENLRRYRTEDPARFDELFDECSETILEEVEKLKKLTNEFSQFARMPKPRFERLDLGEALENVGQLYASARSDVAVAIDVSGPGPTCIQGDRDQLNRVFVNLFQNAFDALPGEGGRVSARVWRENGRARVRFEDNGCGMSPDVLRDIFTPYFTTKEKGTGLGLAMAQRIVQDHHAAIEAYSEEGKGTRFEMEFELAE